MISLLGEGLKSLLGAQLLGLYLTGSLTYGDFDRNSSDIDFVVILEKLLSKDQIQKIQDLHTKIGSSYPKWSNRIECSYLTRKMLLDTTTPLEPRPYVNEGNFWESAYYGDEWLLNLHALYVCGVPVFGPKPNELIGPINIELVRETSKKNLLQEWVPRLNGPSDFFDSHRQVYAVFTFCRILHRNFNDEIASKRMAATWVKKTYGEPWQSLINQAEEWRPGQEINARAQVLYFLRFTLDKIQVA